MTPASTTAAPATDAFVVDDVSKIFVGKNQVQALANIDLRFRAGSFTCIVGPSGCGKSTLLRILGELETATAGHVHNNLPESKVPRSAFVFQDHGALPWFTVLQNVAFGEHMASVGKREREEHARHWISEVGLAGFEQAYPHQLSGGMRQRIAIARAFATGSPSLLMDEPLGALDAQTRILMQEQLVELWEAERKTVVLVTHSIEEALLLGDRIVVMSARPGRVKETIEVPFGRPRTVDIETDPEFTRMKQDIWESLRDEVQASLRFS
ncbi:ABC transporter ATP-binding protein [Saccharomonospora piscinae]|uniref:ABC transporter ATP-binding protein n=1 Tax=Saccharomonospora piscinae TaxID=687388 RepID=UPI000466098A|nr:ABC transporter ATP-binding protein [Saccharomonospora piscinae]